MWGTLRVADRDRREAVRGSEFSGLDAIEVESDEAEPMLRLVFLGRTPANLAPANISIEVPPGTPRLHAVSVERRRGDDAMPEHLTVRLDRKGGPGVYRLRLVGTRADGSPSNRPPRSLDGRFVELGFSFDPQHPVPGPAPSTPVPHSPVEDLPNTYLARDFAGLKRLLLDRLAVTQPGHREEHVADFAVMLLELFAAVGDDLAYAQDDAATEAYLSSARRRTSVRRHARLVGYRLHEGCNARAWVCAHVTQDLELPLAELRFSAPGGVASPSDATGLPPPRVYFAPIGAGLDADVAARQARFRVAHNKMAVWSFGERDSRLQAGATSVAIVDGDSVVVDRSPTGRIGNPERILDLEVGDVIVLEATRHESGVGPPDPTARHAVRLTRVDRRFDLLYGQPYVDVGWSFEDQLPFDLQVSAIGPEGEAVPCALAFGNVVHVAQGRPTEATVDVADPELPHTDLTFAERFPRPFVVARHQARELRLLDERLRAAVLSWQRSADLGWPLSDALVDHLVEIFGAALEDLPKGDTRDDAWYQADLLADLLGRLDRLLEVRRERAEELAQRCEADGVLDASLLSELADSWGAGLVSTLDPSSPASAGPAESAFVNDPRRAVPQVVLTAVPAEGESREQPVWKAELDLLRSAVDARNFVVETGDLGELRLRFPPEAPMPESGQFRARYWKGNGPVGNVPPEAINAFELDGDTVVPDGVVRARNPLAARGGTAPELVEDAKREIPDSFKVGQPRALVASEYAAKARLLEGVGAAAAERRWTGSGRLIDVCVQPTGAHDPPDWFLREVAHRLERVRRMGDIVRVLPPRYGALSISLDVLAAPDSDPVTLEARIRRRLGSGMYTNSIPAMFNPSALSFGQTVWASSVVATVQGLEGVRDVTLVDWTRLPAPSHRTPPATPVDRIRFGGLEIPRLDDDPVHPDNGWLDVRIRMA